MPNLFEPNHGLLAKDETLRIPSLLARTSMTNLAFVYGSTTIAVTTSAHKKI